MKADLSTQHAGNVSKFHQEVIVQALLAVEVCEWYSESSVLDRLAIMVYNQRLIFYSNKTYFQAFIGKKSKISKGGKSFWSLKFVI